MSLIEHFSQQASLRSWGWIWVDKIPDYSDSRLASSAVVRGSPPCSFEEWPVAERKLQTANHYHHHHLRITASIISISSSSKFVTSCVFRVRAEMEYTIYQLSIK